MHFSWAMDLDPKGANSQIKDALDRSMNKAAQENNDIGTPQLDSGDNLLHEEIDDDDEMMQDGSGSGNWLIIRCMLFKIEKYQFSIYLYFRI